MKTNANLSKQTTPFPIVAAFDFDGTITYRDSLVYFLEFVIGPRSLLLKLGLLLPFFIAFWIGLISRQAIKEKVLKKCLKGKCSSEIESKGVLFSNQMINRLVRPEAIQKLQWHLAQGHRCILISATLDIYLKPWAAQMQFDDLIASRLEVDRTNKISGKLLGLNCWGSEKTRRLTELLGPKTNYVLYAYGDSRGDRELLELADYSFYRKLDFLPEDYKVRVN